MVKRRYLVFLLIMICACILIFKNVGVISSGSPDSVVRQVSCHKEIRQAEDWSPPTLPTFLVNASQENPDLVKHICKEWLLPPFTGHRNLNSPKRQHFSQRGQSKFIDELLKGRTDGFFIECGAADGEGLSNSLFFEISRNWTGLLVEANPDLFRSVLNKRRHAYMVNACLSPTTKAISMPFVTANYIGGIPKYMERTHQRRIKDDFADVNTIEVQCFPMYSILKALNVTHVDYFSLDIEGAELEVLYTLPLDVVTVDVFSIEYKVTNNPIASKEKLKGIKKYLVDGYGYKIVKIDSSEDVILSKA